jgi:fumarate hydratase class II
MSTPRRAPPAADPAPWGAETTKAIANFPISGQPLPWELIRALVQVKAAAATANARRRVIPSDVARAIVAAAEHTLAEPRPDWFPVDVFQTGSGTSTNMNVNEVLATMASARLGRPVHPNDHVNASQSSNDVFPTAIRVAALGLLLHGLEPALGELEASLAGQARRHRTAVKAGRTHLMDAAPITFGQELRGWARQVQLSRQRLLAVVPRVGELPLGGSAVGTGLNVPAGFARAVIRSLAERLELPLVEAVDHVEAQSAQDALVEASAAVRSVALALYKIAGDLRLLSSGPHTGLAEISLPALQKGSSIMPGKVNPVIPEAVQQVAAQVVGNDAAIVFAATLSTLQLNTAMPVMARNLLESLRLTTAAAALLAGSCVDGIVVDEATMRRYAETSPAVATALAPLVGYDRAAEIVATAAREGASIRDVALRDLVGGEAGFSADQVAAALDVLAMTRGAVSPSLDSRKPRRR